MASGRDVKDAIVKEISTAKVDPMELDLSSLASVRKFASDFSSSGRPLSLLMTFSFDKSFVGYHEDQRHVKDREGRIVNVSSESHCSPYPEGIRFDKIIDQPGATTCYVALNPQVKGVSGEYFSGCNPAAASSESRDAELAKKLWDFSMDLAMFCWTGLRPLAPEEIKWTNAYCSLPFEEGTSGFSASSTAEDVTQGIDGSGLTAIVTGASSGIGAETARVLALRGVHVVMGVRNLEAGRAVKEAIVKGNPNAKLDAMDLDLSSMASVKKFAEDFKSLNLPLNLLIYTFVSNNAGIMATPFMLSRDNIELQFATNHVGHFLLTNLLMETIRKTARASREEGRIVNVSSRRHKFSYPEGIRFAKLNDPSGYNSLSAYGQSKLANILHANELARQLKEDRVEVTANSVHPGLIATNLFRHYSFLTGLVGLVGKYVIKNVQQGAATTCYVALHPKVKGMSGQYFADSSIAKASLQANDAELATKLWDFSLDLVRRGSTPS
ncbi:short-chain dehydrogenase TIC 32 [Populus alba x Populus x berolinensis]|nr:short-chain dehydrogenase TIC 32 [Populus alba x Populus x berolinensis]